jgi:hypothetical protein
LVVFSEADVYKWDLRHGERSLTCWQAPLRHRSPSASVARPLAACGHEFDCSQLSCSSLPAMYEFRLRFCFRSTFLPPFAPRSLGVSSLLWRLSHPSAFHMRSCGDPRFTTPESSCRSVSNHPGPSHVRFLHARFLSRSGCVTVGPFPVCAHRFTRLHHPIAGSPRIKAESSFLSYGPTDSPSVALHPALRRRSYGWLSASRASGWECFHLLFRCALGRTVGRTLCAPATANS